MEQAEKFRFGESHRGHTAGDPECDECWREPMPCLACGGLVHYEFGDESYDGYWLYRYCDRCGDEYEDGVD